MSSLYILHIYIFTSFSIYYTFFVLSSCLILFVIMLSLSFYYSFLPSLIFLFMIFVFLFLLFYWFPHFHSISPSLFCFAFAFRCIFVMQKPRLSTNSFPQFLHSRVLYYQALHLQCLLLFFSFQQTYFLHQKQNKFSLFSCSLSLSLSYNHAGSIDFVSSHFVSPFHLLSHSFLEAQIGWKRIKFWAV